MHYFLTGATGFLGSRVADQLLAAGHELTVLARTPADASDLADRGATVVEGDITERETMHEPMDGVDGVFHMAAWYRVGADNARAREINVEGTRNVCSLMDELSVPKGVYTSTLAVNSDTGGEVVDESYRHDGPHLSTYDATKWEAHHEVALPMAEAGLPLTIVMPGVIYGPGDTSDMRTMWTEWLTGNLPVIPRKTAYCWGHVDDIARAHVQAMEAGDPGEEYIVAGEPATLVEAFDIASGAIGRSPPRPVPPALFRGASALAGLADRLVDLPPQYHPEGLRVLAGATYLGDNTKARRELGIEHRPLEEGLAATIGHLQATLEAGD